MHRDFDVALSAFQPESRPLIERELFGPEDLVKLLEENTGLHITGTSSFDQNYLHIELFAYLAWKFVPQANSTFPTINF